MFVVELSLKDFPMPDLQEFLTMENPVVNFEPSPLPKIKDITLPRNQWYFHQTKKPQNEASGQGDYQQEQAQRVKVGGNSIVNWTTVLAFFIAIDSIWFIHRMAKTYATAKMMLYGCPTFIDCRNSHTRKCMTVNYQLFKD